MLIDILINKQSKNESEVVVVMAQNETIREYHTALKEAELMPELLTLSGLAAINAIQHSGSPPEEFIFLDLRLNSGALFLVSQGALQLVRPLGFDRSVRFPGAI